MTDTEARRLWDREYRRRKRREDPLVRAREQEYNQRPEVKEKSRLRARLRGSKPRTDAVRAYERKYKSRRRCNPLLLRREKELRENTLLMRPTPPSFREQQQLEVQAACQSIPELADLIREQQIDNRRICQSRFVVSLDRPLATDDGEGSRLLDFLSRDEDGELTLWGEKVRG